MSISRFQYKKSVHVNLNKDTHAEFRMALFRRGLSMQEVFEFLAIKVVDEDETLAKFLDEIEYNKKNKGGAKQVNSTDAESIFDVIEQQNPLEGR
jgi:hypothetical protein